MQALDELTRNIKGSFAAGVIYHVARQHLNQLFAGDAFAAFVWAKDNGIEVDGYDSSSISLRPEGSMNPTFCGY